MSQATGAIARYLVPAADLENEGFIRALLRDQGVAGALSGHRWRLLHTQPVEDEDDAMALPPTTEAVVYDYSRNVTLRVRGPAGGAGPFRVSSAYEQPVPSPDEFAAAVALVACSPVWGNLLCTDYVRPYPPMPPVLEAAPGQAVDRTLYVGLMSRPRRFNRIVAVNMVTQEVSREPATPDRSLAVERVCGVENLACGSPRRGAPGSLILQWPAAKPIWSMQVIRPATSSGINASGVELRNVRYHGRSVLKQAHVPILNVQYDDDACGPYRDWLWQETCFEAVGRNIRGARGFRQCSQPPRTILEKGSDGGNFTGVAVYNTEDGGLGIVSQLMAGWYRYVMRWLFYPDGRILPQFGFDGVADSCVCNTHHHHALWRLDFDVVEPRNVVEELVDQAWTPLQTETSRRRAEDLSPRWRVRNPRNGAGYEIIPGPEDGVGDAFSGDDLYALRYKRNRELDDGRGVITGNVATNLAPLVNGEKIASQDIVVWYAAHFRHEVAEDPAPHLADHNVLGPTLQPFDWPTGSG
jgi:hypothetical protein